MRAAGSQSSAQNLIQLSWLFCGTWNHLNKHLKQDRLTTVRKLTFHFILAAEDGKVIFLSFNYRSAARGPEGSNSVSFPEFELRPLDAIRLTSLRIALMIRWIQFVWPPSRLLTGLSWEKTTGEKNMFRQLLWDFLLGFLAHLVRCQITPRVQLLWRECCVPKKNTNRRVLQM